LTLTWYRAYDAELARWLSRDPLESITGEMPEMVQGPNLYQYAFNNPVNWIDPLGLDVWVSGGLHESINVGDPNGKYNTWGFGLDLTKPFTLENGFNGVIYRDDGSGGPPKCPSLHKKTTPKEDKKMKDILDKMDGMNMPYRLTCPNCRTFAREMFKYFTKE
jgi:RHS repeat-associated protein